MNQKLRNIYHQIELMQDREQMLSVLAGMLSYCSDIIAERDTLLQAQTEMALQFQQMKDELAGTKEENSLLRKENLRLSDQLGLRRRELYGRGTEKISEILEKALSGEESEDPLGDEELLGQTKDPAVSGTIQKLSDAASGNGNSNKCRNRKTSGKREQDLSALPKHVAHILTITLSIFLMSCHIKQWVRIRTFFQSLCHGPRPTKIMRNSRRKRLSASLRIRSLLLLQNRRSRTGGR